MGADKSWLKPFLALGAFAILVIFVLFAAFHYLQGVAHGVFIMKQQDDLELRKARFALVITSFHSYYHEWPCQPGEITDEAVCELMGCREAGINTRHINFFAKNGDGQVDSNDDLKGRNLWFSPDDEIGTCRVFEAPEN